MNNKFFLTLILLIFVHNSAHANSCIKYLSQGKIEHTEFDKKNLVLQNMIVGNFRFPQVNFGINLGLVSLILKEKIYALDFSFSEKDALIMYEHALRAHKAHGITVRIHEGEVYKIMQTSLNGLPKKVVMMIQMLALNSPNHNLVLKPYPHELEYLLSNRHDFSKILIELYNLQSNEGKAYLVRVGEIIHQFLWSEYVKSLSKEWRSSLENGLAAEHYTKLSSSFEGRFINHLVSAQPDLNHRAWSKNSKLQPDHFYMLTKNHDLDKLFLDTWSEYSFAKVLYDIIK